MIASGVTEGPLAPGVPNIDADIREREAAASDARELHAVAMKFDVRNTKLHRALGRAASGTEKIPVAAGDVLNITTLRWARSIWVAARRWHRVAAENDADRRFAGTSLPESMLSAGDLRARPVPVEGLGFKVAAALFEYAQTAATPHDVVTQLAHYREKLGQYDGGYSGIRKLDTEIGIAGYLRQLDRYFEHVGWNPPPPWVPEPRSSRPMVGLNTPTSVCSAGTNEPKVNAQARAPWAPVRPTRSRQPTTKRRKITAKQANQRALKLLRAIPAMTVRDLASAIPCSVGLVVRLSAYQKVRDSLRARRVPREVPLSDQMLASVSTDDASARWMIERLVSEGESEVREQAARRRRGKGSQH